MARYALNLPTQLKHDAERLASQQGVSLNQFILWAVADKVGALNQQLDDPAFPQITYRRGASGQLRPVVRGTAIHVQTLVVAAQQWHDSPAEVAYQYDLTEAQVNEALAYYESHREEIDAALDAEARLEAEYGQATASS
ncbi:MAG TPA: DUF433 domain-containing protein [Ardenticatenaceae bacterium]|nr:DUF433 domain-containing protein [Ardenticatenaceae bacterium]